MYKYILILISMINLLCIKTFILLEDPCCDLFLTIKVRILNEIDKEPVENANVKERVCAQGLKNERYYHHKSDSNGNVKISIANYFPRKYHPTIGVEVKVEKNGFYSWVGFFKKNDSLNIYLKPKKDIE